MPRKTAPLLPATSELLRQFGERLRVARLRRRLSAKQVAERAGMNPMTLRSLERGGSGVTIGGYLAVMQVLGIEKELDQIAQADPLGRSLQDARFAKPDVFYPGGGVSEAMTMTSLLAAGEPQASRSSSEPRKTSTTSARAAKRTRAASDARSRLDEGNFVSSRKLAGLLSDATTQSSRPGTRPKSKPPTKATSSRAKRR